MIGSRSGFGAFAAKPVDDKKADACSIFGFDGKCWANVSRDGYVPAGGYNSVPNFAAVLAAMKTGSTNMSLVMLGGTKYITIRCEAGTEPKLVCKRGPDSIIFAQAKTSVVLCTAGAAIRPEMMLDGAVGVADFLRSLSI